MSFSHLKSAVKSRKYEYLRLTKWIVGSILDSAFCIRCVFAPVDWQARGRRTDRFDHSDQRVEDFELGVLINKKLFWKFWLKFITSDKDISDFRDFTVKWVPNVLNTKTRLKFTTLINNVLAKFWPISFALVRSTSCSVLFCFREAESVV
jgi:hypothetical protein